LSYLLAPRRGKSQHKIRQRIVPAQSMSYPGAGGPHALPQRHELCCQLYSNGDTASSSKDPLITLIDQSSVDAIRNASLLLRVALGIGICCRILQDMRIKMDSAHRKQLRYSACCSGVRPLPRFRTLICVDLPVPRWSSSTTLKFAAACRSHPAESTGVGDSNPGPPADVDFIGGFFYGHH
jgi:hypothetical protein